MSSKKLIQLHFPMGGLLKRVAFQHQAPYYTVDSQNFIPDDAISERERGGSRPGLIKSYAQQLGSGNKVNLITEVSAVISSTLTHKLVAASNGTLYQDASGTMTAQSGATIASDTMVSADDWGQKLYIAGNSSSTRNLLVYDPVAATLGTVTASAGTVPTKCKIVKRWRDRLVMAEDADNPHLWYMGKMGDPTNWDYTETGFDRAISATVSRAGRLGEPCTAVCPHGDDCCIFGMTSSIGIMRGDPAYNGQVDILSEEVGIHGRGSWCHDSDGVFWCWTQDGLYRMDAPCGGKLRSVSRELLPAELINVSPSSYTITLAYDFRFRGIHVCVSSNSSTDNSFYFIDTHHFNQTGQVSFWKQAYSNDHAPFSLHARRTASSTQSLVIWGGRDGYLRNWSTAVSQDDGTAYTSYVYIGPLGGDYYDYLLEQFVIATDAASGDMAWSVYAGDNAQAAYESDKPKATGTFKRAGVQQTQYPRVRGSAIFLKLSNGETNGDVAYESGQALLANVGRRRV